MVRCFNVTVYMAILSFATRGACFLFQIGRKKQYIKRLRASFFDDYDVDMIEMMVGGNRYEMVDLPDSMMDTTLYVGNLCEFVTDDMLSTLFQEVSTLNFIPACVARRPNFSSLQYGFVTFPTIEEKEAAKKRFSGFKLNDRRLRLEEIQDKPNRVRVPEKLVYYSVGQEKRTRDGSKNTLRKANNSRDPDKVDTMQKSSRHLRGKKISSPTASSLFSDLNDSDKVAFERACRKGYLSLDGYYRSRSPLLSTHRIWCNGQDRPQMILRKGHSGKVLDDFIIDFSPLSNYVSMNDELLTSWKIKLMTVAQKLGMTLKCITDHASDQVEQTENDEGLQLESCRFSFEGPRESSKAMARQVASIWEECKPTDDDSQDHDDVVRIKSNVKRRQQR